MSHILKSQDLVEHVEELCFQDGITPGGQYVYLINAMA